MGAVAIGGIRFIFDLELVASAEPFDDFLVALFVSGLQIVGVPSKTQRGRLIGCCVLLRSEGVFLKIACELVSGGLGIDLDSAASHIDYKNGGTKPHRMQKTAMGIVFTVVWSIVHFYHEAN